MEPGQTRSAAIAVSLHPPTGSPIDFTFNIDKSGMLTVIAVERSKERECKLIVETKAGDLSFNDVAKLAKEVTLIKIQ